MFDSNKDMEDYLRNRDKNLALVLEYLGKNAPFFSSVGGVVSDNQKAINLLISAISHQSERIARLEEALIRGITANLSANNQVQNNFNTLLIAQSKNTEDIASIIQSIRDQSMTIKNQSEFNDKAKVLLDFLVLAIPSESGSDSIKKNKNPKLNETI